MAWAKLEGRYAFHPKVIAAGDEAIGVHARMLAYAVENATNGAISETLAAAISGGVQRKIDRLVSVGLLDRCEDGGYQLHDFLDYNPPAAELIARREAMTKQRREAGLRGAAARWKTDGKTDGKTKQGSRNPDLTVTHGYDGKDDETHDESHDEPSYGLPSDPMTNGMANGMANGWPVSVSVTKRDRNAGKAHGEGSKIANAAANLVPHYKASARPPTAAPTLDVSSPMLPKGKG